MNNNIFINKIAKYNNIILLFFIFIYEDLIFLLKNISLFLFILIYLILLLFWFLLISLLKNSFQVNLYSIFEYHLYELIFYEFLAGQKKSITIHPSIF